MRTTTKTGRKSQPLTAFLRRQPGDVKPMSFDEVERVIGQRLPDSARRHRAWWSNNPQNSVMTQAWLDAGFESEQVDMTRRRLVFRRIAGCRCPRSHPARAHLNIHSSDG